MAELISDPDRDQLIRKILDRAIRSVDAERGVLFLNNESSELSAALARDNKGRDLEDDVRYSTTVVREVFEKGEGLCLRIGDSDQAADLSASVVDLKLRAVLCVRLRFRDKSLGVIYVDSRVTTREFTKRDLRFFDAMAVALSIALENHRLVQEAIERERLQRALEIAKQVLIELLPADPKGQSGFDIAGRSTPAETAAGDYYDFIKQPGGKLGLVLGDVTGHGIGPAMVMTGARSAVRTLFEGDLAEAQILNRLNQRLAEDLADDIFMSMIVCRLDSDNRCLNYSNAGQTAPVLLRASGELEILPGSGLALGIEPEFEYTNLTPVEMHPGDLLVIFTDGILEVRNPAGDEFGEDRLAECLQRLRTQPAAEIVSGLEGAAYDFAAGREQEDDITLIVVKALEE